MIDLDRYRITEQLYKSSKSVVYKGYREDDQMPVVIKLINSEYPTANELARLKREFDITRNISTQGVIKFYSMEKYKNGYVIIMEDFGGIDLSELLSSKKFDLLTNLSIILSITESLGEIHECNIIHKDINPTNILYNPHTDKVKIIDFDISTALTRESPELKNPDVLEGTLHYISPEQTGRMNRSIDYRTDYYSLGVTFYEMLTGKKPFESDDPMELIHCHIAREPQPPDQRIPDIPETVSNIIMKLMAKNAEDRYQSIYGLKCDLNRCVYELQAANRIPPFPIGQNDISSRFRISQKLYGREEEIHLLMDAFERIRQGMKELILVTGYAGIGKTSLVNEVQKAIVKRHGYFITGKCSQFKRDIPYLPFIDAYKSLITQVLTENKASVSDWKSKITMALGRNGKLITDVIPELELIIGKQPNVPDLPPKEAKNRFNLVFQNFIQVFATPEQPLILFFDDLQWSDAASLEFIKRMMISSEIHHLMLIGAYRDNNVSAAHPLMLAIDELVQQNISINTIQIKPVTQEQVSRLISDTLNCDLIKAYPLSELCMQKTMGNPFFLNQLLLSLYKNNHIAFNQDQGIWQWDMQAIAAINVTDNVVQLMVEKIQQQPEETQNALKLAACMGTRFDLKILATLLQMSLEDAAKSLWHAAQEGFVKADSNIWIIDLKNDVSVQILDQNNPPVFTFLHDRIQQAAYSLMDEQQKKQAHYRVGQQLLTSAKSTEIEEHIFHITNHLNMGRALIKDRQEQLKLAELNLQSAKKAKASAAYQPAYNHLKIGLELLGDESWKDHRLLTIDFYSELAEAAYLNSFFEESNRFAQEAIDNTGNLLDSIPIYRIKIQSEISRKNNLEAVKTGLYVLSLLNVKFSLFPSKAQVVLGLINVKRLLLKKRPEDLIHIPDQNTAEILAVHQILKEIISASYLVSPNLLPLLIFKVIGLSAVYGNSVYLCSAAAMYGSVLCGLLNDIDNGYGFGKLAIELLEKFESKQEKPKTFFMFGNFIKHWKEHLKGTLDILLEVYKSGLETGDHEYAAYGAQNYCYHLFFTGKELPKVNKKLIRYGLAVEQLNQKTVMAWNSIYKQSVANLIGESGNPCQLIGPFFDEDKMLPVFLESDEKVALFEINFQKVILNYLFEKYEDAMEFARKAETYLDAVVSTFSVVILHYYQSLILLALLPENNTLRRARIWAKMKKNHKKLKKWADFAPMNHQHRYDLVQAERHSALNEIAAAAQFYTKAIEGAQINGYLQDEALANELAARFYFKQYNFKIAGVYLQDALYLYHRWGANAKVDWLEKKYARYKFRKTPLSVSIPTQQKTCHVTSTETTTSEILDLKTVIKASQAISMEIVLNRLLESMMHIMIENAGAQKGIIILANQGDFFVEAISVSDQDDLLLFQKQSIDESDDIPVSIVNYVIRTQTPLILYNAAKEGTFSKDAYVKQKHPKSILCLPIISHGKLTGILYLENNLVSSAFTNERIELLKILSSQMAISINNARLYGELESKNIDLERANLQISHLLKATAEMTLAKDKVTACITAIKHLMALEKGFVGTRTELFLPQRSGDSFTGYTVWKYDNIVENIQPFEIEPEKGKHLKEISDMMYFQNNFMIPIGSKERIQAVIEIKTGENQQNIHVTESDYIKGIAHSLAMALENIDSVENTRLAGIGTMAASIIHDLKNPIGVISGYAEMAVDEDLNRHERVEYLNIISKEAARMSNMAGEVLEFSRGELQLKIDEIDSALFGKELTQMLDPLFTSHNISFEFNTDYEGVLTMDAERMRRVILNLATNARDAMMNKNTANSRFVLHLNRNDQGITIIAEDNGPGIPEHIQATLFEPFVTYGKNYGTGLGMAIVKKIIDTHNGKISFRSEKEKGTIFTILLPMDLKKGDPVETDSIYPEALDRLDKYVLVVDDDPNYRQLYGKYLKSWGCTFREASSGDHALYKLKQAKTSGKRPFDFVLIDKQMPGMDGEMLGAEIKKDEMLRDTQLIMITSKGLRGDADRISKVGFAGYLTKPVSKNQLYQCLDRLSDHNQEQQPLLTKYNLPDAHKQKIRILLAEDNPVNQKLMASIMKKGGFNTDIVSNGEEVLNALAMTKYDIVLMDVQMPIVDGIEATRIIRDPGSNVIDHDTIIVALTAHSGEKEINSCLESGMNAYIPKPIKISQLEEMIHRFVPSPV